MKHFYASVFNRCYNRKVRGLVRRQGHQEQSSSLKFVY